MPKIIKNATVEYRDGVSETFDLLQIVENGALIGRIVRDIDTDTTEVFVCGFIPKTSIRQIKKRDLKKNQSMD
jgi:hypothetical protein